MIKNIFLPEKIGSYFLFSKRIVSIDITKMALYGTVVLLKGRTISVEETLTVPIEQSYQNQNQEHIVAAIKKVISLVPKYDELRVSFSSAHVFFKELKLPFIEREKIAQIIAFEVEPLIPFPVQDAVIDFIITKTIPEEKSSHILVACVQKTYIADYIALFERAGTNLNTIVIDFFGLIGLLTAIPNYLSDNRSTVVVDFEYNSTKVAYINNGQIRFIRSIAQGINQVVKSVSEALTISMQESLDLIMRFGLTATDSPQSTEVVRTAYKKFFDVVGYTISSFANQSEEKNISQVIFFGPESEIKGITDFATELLGMECALFDTQKIASVPHIIIKKNGIPLSHLISFSTAVPWPLLDTFNLVSKEFTPKKTKLLLFQLITFISLVLIIFGLVVTQYTLQIIKIRSEAIQSEQEGLEILKEQFKKIPQDENDLEEVVSLAQKEVESEKETWFAFSYANQARYLQYLLELTSKIDRKTLGFVIQKLTIGEGTIILKAQVKGHESLKILERELRSSSLFSYVEPQDETNFTMHISLAPTIEEL